MTDTQRGLVPRLAACKILAAVDKGTALEDAFATQFKTVPIQDQPLVRELVLGVLRHGRLYEVLCRRYLKKGKQHPDLLRMLSLAAHQLFAMERIPAFAIGTTTVGCIRALKHPYLAGVVNAVVRKLTTVQVDSSLDDDESLVGPLLHLKRSDWPKNKMIRHGLPDALAEECAEATDEDLSYLTHRPPLCTVDYGEQVYEADAPILKREAPWTWWSDPQYALSGPVADGQCAVQDRSQGWMIDIVRPQAGALVLDVCASPGGKSRAFRQAGCRVISADCSLEKMERLSENLGLGRLVVQDGRFPAFAPKSFDYVVVDAPCSNSGVWARRPEAMRRYHAEDLASLKTLQMHLIEQAAALVKPSGQLIYSTCSLAAIENTGVASSLTGWQMVTEHTAWPNAWQAGAYCSVLERVAT